MKPTHIVLHCSDSTWGDYEEIRRWHTEKPPRGNGWADIGYHFVIQNPFPRGTSRRDDSSDGLVAVGRPESADGAHALGYNERSLGICLVGRTRFTPKQFAALEGLVRMLMSRHGIPVEHVIGHCETEHEKARGRAGKTCPNFDVGAFRARLANPKARS